MYALQQHALRSGGFVNGGRRSRRAGDRCRSARPLIRSSAAPPAAAAAASQQHQQAAWLRGAGHAVERRCRCSSSAGDASASTSSEPAPLVVVEGDVVTFHMTCRTQDGKVLESSRDAGEPLSFEIGAGEVMGNPLFQAFDGSLRGLGVGDSIELEISGGQWNKDLLFIVPREHPEVERLEGRYKNLGGLRKDLAVELSNGNMAVVVEVTPEHVQLDANNMMSGKTLNFELQVVSIDRH